MGEKHFLWCGLDSFGAIGCVFTRDVLPVPRTYLRLDTSCFLSDLLLSSFHRFPSVRRHVLCFVVLSPFSFALLRCVLVVVGRPPCPLGSTLLARLDSCVAVRFPVCCRRWIDRVSILGRLRTPLGTVYQVKKIDFFVACHSLTRRPSAT